MTFANTARLARSVVIGALFLVRPLSAQGIGLAASAGIAAPTYAVYSFGSGTTEKRVDQYSSPFAFIYPVSKNFTLDISTSYAASTVTTGGAVTSSIAGLTDTQVRGNYVMFDQHAAFTFGLNLPTGRYTVTQDQQEAAGQIGNAFLLMPVGGMGTGTGATAALAVAQRLGDWNVGVSGSMRKTSRFDAYQLSSGVLRFQPGDEYRLRVGVDRPIGAGSMNASINYSKFGDDRIDSSAFATGDRTMLQAGLNLPIGRTDLQVGMWDLYKSPGELIGARSPWENILDFSVAWGLRAAKMYLQTGVEQRIWQIGGARAGDMTNFSIRTQFGTGSWIFAPSFTSSLGTIRSAVGGPSADIQGTRFQVLIRYH